MPSRIRGATRRRHSAANRASPRLHRVIRQAHRHNRLVVRNHAVHVECHLKQIAERHDRLLNDARARTENDESEVSMISTPPVKVFSAQSLK